MKNVEAFKVLIMALLVGSLVMMNNAYSHGDGHHKVPKKKAEKYGMDHSGHDMSNASGEKMKRADALKKSKDVVAVMNAWVREAVPESPVIGGYLTLVNASDKAATIDKIESSQFDSVEVHKMGEVDGMMQMQKIDQLTVDVGGSVVLKPGGKHLMMMGPEKDLVVGDNVEVVLHFSDGAVQVINLPVKK